MSDDKLEIIANAIMTQKDGFIFVRSGDYVIKLDQKTLKEVGRYNVNLAFFGEDKI